MDGRGAYGITNQNSIGVELCQDVTTGANVWQWDFHPTTRAQSILVFAKLMKEYNVPLSRVVRHYDASRKSCPGNWMANDWAKWKLWKKDLETYVTTGRLVDSQRGLDYSNGKTTVKPTMTNSEVASQVLKGLWGNGEDRKTRLTNAGYNYDAVQAEVQKQKAQTANTTTAKTTTTQKVETKTTETSKLLPLKDIVEEVIQGKWGVGNTRKSKLTKAGYDYKTVQDAVTKTMKERKGSGYDSATGTVKSTTQAEVKKAETPKAKDRYQFTTDVRIRRQPNTGVGTDTGLLYNVGETVEADAIISQNGYDWIKYTTHGGTTMYVALGITNGSRFARKV